MALTDKQIADLNKMNKAAQNVALGTLLADFVGASDTPDAGAIQSLSAREYSLAPAAPSATATKAAIALTASAQPTVTAGITQPDFPRVLTAKGNASGIAGDVVITGTNFADAVITDTIALSGSSEVVGAKAFKTVTSIAYPAETNAGTDTVSIGRADKYGFPEAIPNASLVLAKTFDGAVDAGTVTAAATVEGSVYDPAGTVNGAKVLKLVYLS
jgi:hypothetical protein